MLLPIPEDVLAQEARDRLLNVLLGSLGVSAAAVAASFAIYMIATAPGNGAVAAPDHVAVAEGAGVSHLRRAVSMASPRPMAGLVDNDPGDALDFDPTGTIADPAAARSADRAPAPDSALADFAVRDVFDDTALVEAHGTLQVVRTGSVLPGAGEVLSITHGRFGWVVATAAGPIRQRR